MSQSLDPAVRDLSVKALLEAIRRQGVRALEGAGGLEIGRFRQVERLMRMAIDLSNVRVKGVPNVYIRGVKPDPDEALAVPEVLTVSLSDLLAARAADHLADALAGDPAAFRAIEAEAERILTTEEIQMA
jgi:hypothetical protein